MDCALAEIESPKDPKILLTAFPKNIGQLKPDPIPPDRGMTVAKAGAATHVTNGTIVDVDADLWVDFSFGTFLFSNQVVIDGGRDDTEFAFATEGDSGSIVVDTQSKQATAMIFAASGRFALACPLRVQKPPGVEGGTGVLDRLEASLGPLVLLPSDKGN